MTLNLKSVAFVPYVGQFSVICLVVLATFDNFVRRLIFRKKRATCRPAAAGKNLAKFNNESFVWADEL